MKLAEADRRANGQGGRTESGRPTGRAGKTETARIGLTRQSPTDDSGCEASHSPHITTRRAACGPAWRASVGLGRCCPFGAYTSLLPFQAHEVRGSLSHAPS